MNLRNLTDQELVNHILNERKPDSSVEYMLAERLQRALDAIEALAAEVPSCSPGEASHGNDARG